jgi:hypothetical protein
VTTTDGHSNPIVWVLGAERQAGPDFQGEKSPRLSWTACAFAVKCVENLALEGLSQLVSDCFDFARQRRR